MRISDWSSDVCSSDLVRFFGSGGVHTRADTATLRAVFERGALAVLAGDFARFTHELANGWHDLYASCVYELRTCVLLRIRIKRLLPKRLARSEEHTSELESLMRNTYAVACLKRTKKPNH